MAAQGPTKIYVGGLVDSLAGITTDELRQLFSPFGSIINIEIPKDPYTGKNRGHAFIQYRQAQEARDAMAAMHCFDIGGKQVKVGFAADEQATRTPVSKANKICCHHDKIRQQQESQWWTRTKTNYCMGEP